MYSCHNPQKKAPGPDKINFQILRMIWEWDKMQITSMVQQVIRLGYYPKAWKRAWGILLEKGGKRDFGLVRSYRVISLLNCMGKILEKAVAEQLFQFFKAYFKLHPGQMGARKERSREKSSNGWVDGWMGSWKRSGLPNGRAILMTAYQVEILPPISSR